MMDCERANNLISAKIDGEIAIDDAAELDTHLSGCAGCRATLEALKDQDSQLQRAFAPRHKAAATLARSAMQRIRREQVQPRRFMWLNMLAAAAAGFAIAALVFQPWKQARSGGTGPIAVNPTTNPTNPGPPPIAHLALATDQIQILSPTDSQWQVMPTGAAIAPGSRVRTGNTGRAEFAMADGSIIRLNSGSEIAFKGARSCDLNKGQLWSSVSPAEVPFIVAVAQATVTAVGTQFDILAQPEEATVTVLEGSTKVIGAGSEQIVMSGEQLKIVNGSPGKANRTYNLLVTTRWVNELLLMKGRDNAELQKRVNDMLAQLGEVKMADLYDEEIRALGDHAVLPLTRYIQSERSSNHADRRQRAARILADIAQPWSIPDLIKLVADADETVRYSAVRGLRRLTGTDLGISPEECRRSAARAKEAFEEWQRWWERNQDRYPSGPMQPISK